MALSMQVETKQRLISDQALVWVSGDLIISAEVYAHQSHLVIIIHLHVSPVTTHDWISLSCSICKWTCVLLFSLSPPEGKARRVRSEAQATQVVCAVIRLTFIKCILGPFGTVHLWLDHLRQMLMPGMNRANISTIKGELWKSGHFFLLSC